MDIRQALTQLCSCCAPSGFEGPAARAARELLQPLVDETWIDRMGNLVGVRRCGKPQARRLLLDAHLDEIGLIVTGMEDGFLRFRTIGGVDPRMLPGRELTICTNPPLTGVVICAGAAQDGKDEDQSVPISKLLVDTGLSGKETERLIPIGTPMTYRGGCTPLGEDQLCGKAMDDRSCFVVLLRAMELLKDTQLDVDVYVLGSVREEVSGAGAVTGAWALEPDFCVAVDVTHGATPDAPADKTFPLGKGPAIGVGPNMTRWMTRRMIERCEQESIPYQLEVMSGHTGTNGWELQISREGVATAVLSLPLKYMHSPIEVLSLADLEHTAALLAAFVRDLGKEGAQ